MAFSRATKASLVIGTGAAVAAGSWIAINGLPAMTQQPASAQGQSPAARSTTPPAPQLRRAARVVFPEPVGSGTTIVLSGRTAPLEQATLTSRATGFVSERRVDIGDKVKSGDVLLTIDAPDVAQELARSKAAIEQVKARQTLAKVNLERAEALVTKGHVSEQIRDERLANAQTAAADLAAAEAEVRRLEQIISFQTVRAPFDGTIISRNVERGDRVTVSDSQSSMGLLRIARLDELRIEVDVPQSSALKVQTGNQAVVTFAEIPNSKFEARVARTSGAIDAASSTMRIELIMKNPEQRIPAGLNGQVALQFAPRVDVVTVPTNTLVVRDGQQRVAVATGEDTVVFRAVSVGRDLGTRVEIVSGLSAQDRVILSPNALLREGDKIDVTMATAATKNTSATK